MLTITVADWNSRPWAGRGVRLVKGEPDFRVPDDAPERAGFVLRQGSLSGVLATDGQGKATVVRVSFLPGQWGDYAVNQLEEV
jgi:ABC-type Na+ transport system ATPase subunit NatA